MKNYFIRLIDTFRNLFKRKPVAVIRHVGDNDYEYNARRAKNREELDRLLDKINHYGKESLTKSEREFLESTHEL